MKSSQKSLHLKDGGLGGVRTRRAPGLLVSQHAHGVRDQRLHGRIGAARQGLLHKGHQLCGEFLELHTSSSGWISLSSIAYGIPVRRTASTAASVQPLLLFPELTHGRMLRYGAHAERPLDSDRGTCLFAMVGTRQCSACWRGSHGENVDGLA